MHVTHGTVVKHACFSTKQFYISTTLATNDIFCVKKKDVYTHKNISTKAITIGVEMYTRRSIQFGRLRTTCLKFVIEKNFKKILFTLQKIVLVGRIKRR